MQTSADLVIIGAGIVGCSAAAELARRGWRSVVVLEQGPLWATGGSSSHAPGLVFQANPSRTMCRLAQSSVRRYAGLSLDGTPAFHGVGSLEVAATPERWQDLKRRSGYARAWGLDTQLLTPDETVARLPLIDGRRIHGALYVPGDGIARPVRACEALGREAQAAGVVFHAGAEVTGIEVTGGRVQAVLSTNGRIATERVLLCAGIWGPRVARMAGVGLPLTPVQHQYARTSALRELHGETREIAHPILRHQDRRMYFRQHGEGYGVGSYAHEPILTAAADIRPHAEGAAMPSLMPWTPEDFRQPWLDAQELLPALRDVEIVDALNGMFSFTPDGLPLIGELAEVGGFWTAEAIWVTHGPGAGEQVAQWLTEGRPGVDLRECDLNRFDAYAASPAYIRTRGAQQYREVYDIIHPLQPLEQPRPLRRSPFYERQRELGAAFFEGRGWERAFWFAANEALLQTYAPQLDWARRSGWAARHWSPIAGVEHLHTRRHVALYDMTPLPRCEISGPGAPAFLDRLLTNRIDRPAGTITYSAMADAAGGLLSDVTVTRLGAEQFWVAHNGPSDLAYFRQQRRQQGAESVTIVDTTGATCCLGVWGPRARELLGALSEDELGNEAFPYLHARRIFVGEVPVLALRVSYVGELGWELYASSEYGARLWELVWAAGQPLGVIAAGRAAFDSLRLEKGYRLYGVDMDRERDAYEAGIGFTVKLGKGEFTGREALAARKAGGPLRLLCCLVFDDPGVAVLGKEPIWDGAELLGYVASANTGYSVQSSIAYGYLPAAHATPGTRLEVEYFGMRSVATVVAEPLWDPKGERLRT